VVHCLAGGSLEHPSLGEQVPALTAKPADRPRDIVPTEVVEIIKVLIGWRWRKRAMLTAGNEVAASYIQSQQALSMAMREMPFCLAVLVHKNLPNLINELIA
jgi:hypothetical protein